MSYWIAALSPEARELVKTEVLEHGKTITAGDGANSHTITLWLIEEIVRLRRDIKELQNGEKEKDESKTENAAKEKAQTLTEKRP